MKFCSFVAVGMALVSILSSCEKKKSVPIVKTTPTYVLDESKKSFSGENAYVHVKTIVEMGPRHTESKAYDQMVAYICQKLESYGWKTSVQEFSLPFNGRLAHMKNVRASLVRKPDSDKSPLGVIGCHIDTKKLGPEYTGANDGASHVGVLLEWARCVAKNPDLYKGVELVFFDGEECEGPQMIPEEDGLMGSGYYASQLKEPLPRWMINVDMVGAFPLRLAVPSDSDPSMYRAYCILARSSSTPESYGTASGTILDDHAPFQARGIPTLNFIADFSNTGWWHTPNDSLKLIHPRSLQQFGDFFSLYVDILLERGKESGDSAP